VTILSAVHELTNTQPLLQGKRVIVSAGGTRESIDPVRFIGNHSSGRQGLAIAYEALKAGADVTVIAGETDPFDLPGATVIKVKSAEDMLKVIEQNFVDADVLVMAAAVADFKVDQDSPVKLKKDEFTHIALVKNPDILATMGAKKRSHQVIVGFAAETAHDIENLGLKKMQSKGADLLYVNDVSGGAVFGQERTSGMLLGMDIAARSFKNESKYVVAQEIVKEIANRLERHG
jgi:phosphopantothenoylcysteine decarboxylase/phosphopantothenate--cysteine ligase